MNFVKFVVVLIMFLSYTEYIISNWNKLLQAIVCIWAGYVFTDAYLEIEEEHLIKELEHWDEN